MVEAHVRDIERLMTEPYFTEVKLEIGDSKLVTGSGKMKISNKEWWS